MRCHLLLIAALLFCGCKRTPVTSAMLMHVVATSYTSDTMNSGSLVISITSGRATGQLLHVRGGKAEPLQTFEFDAASHTLLCSTPEVSGPGEVDASFIQESDIMDSRNKSRELKLGKVFRISRAGGGNTILEKANVLYRIQRTDEKQDRWRPAQEATLDAMIETTKTVDCEYIVLDVHAKP